MRITSGGNVGIGTTSPSEKLEVNGSLRLNDGNVDGPQLKLASSGYSDWNIDNYSGNLRAYYGSSEYFRINSAGNVGINDTAPSTKLDVNGGARFQDTTMIGSNVGLLQFGMDGTRFNSYGYSTAHIKTSILKGADTMIAFNIRGYMYSLNPVDTDVGFYCYAPVSYVYGVTQFAKAYNGWTIGLYYSSDNYVCIYVDGMSTYGGFTLNWINTSLIQWGGKVFALAWTKTNSPNGTAQLLTNQQLQLLNFVRLLLKKIGHLQL